ncbi:hypothetical protein [Hufsiella ginkgonis]|uniref:DUF1351 domain-containing protein n=1 Tax=Hufsiella ginkgonis TaxID=2695274 RepID=A0A7K1Y0V1_9SPHI|nr:hypothetical protein [Hufsiella ginkgonis]MXV16865.1 hypothetical protein [Hufsiella ginkgonis]
MSTAETQTSVIRVEEITSIMAGAGAILQKNETLSIAASNKITGLLDTIEAEGMNAELDKELNKWQVNAKQAVEVMTKRRAPITQMANQVVKAFTALEAPLDPKKADSFYARAQKYRDAWAKECADAEKQRQAEIQKKQNKEKERVTLSAEIERQFRGAYLGKLNEFRTFYTGKLSKATLENIEDVKKVITGIKTVYPRDKFNELSVTVNAVYHDKIELASLINGVRTTIFDELAANFLENMEHLREQLIAEIPSKKTELESIAKADADTKATLLQQQQEREAAQKQAQLDQAAAEKAKSDEQIKLNESIGITNTLFEAAAEMAEVREENTAQVRQGYKILVHNSAGWGAIFLFYFEKEGQKLPVEEFGKKTLNQMKAFCEKHAHKTGEKVESVNLVYEDDFKAVAKKEA